MPGGGPCKLQAFRLTDVETRTYTFTKYDMFYKLNDIALLIINTIACMLYPRDIIC